MKSSVRSLNVLRVAADVTETGRLFHYNHSQNPKKSLAMLKKILAILRRLTLGPIVLGRDMATLVSSENMLSVVNHQQTECSTAQQLFSTACHTDRQTPRALADPRKRSVMETRPNC